jgi:hypothetical protein
MLNYYDEIKNDILAILEDDKEASNILQSEDDEDTIVENLVDYFWTCDSVTGNASGSYYCSSYKARIHCYNYACDVREALESYGYAEKLEIFKTFEFLVDEGYIDIDTMTINDDVFYEEESGYRWCIINDFEAIKELDFETIDVITRCYKLYEVIYNIVENFLK